MTAVVIRGSEYQDFLRCRLRWYFAWQKRLVPKTLNDKLFIGDLIHKFMEHYYRANCDFNVGFQAMRELYQNTDTSGMDEVALNELWTLAENMVKNYHTEYGENDRAFQVLATELPFRIRINDFVTYMGKIDWIGLDSDNLLCFWDHKTTKSLDKYEKNAAMDRQISRYWWALNELCKGNGEIAVKTTDGGRELWVHIKDTNLWGFINGRQVDYFIYNILLKDFPTPPRELKKGGLSKAKDQNTTYALYLKEIQERGLNPEDYQDMLDWLKENPRRYFSRVEVRRNTNEIRCAMKEFYDTALDMMNPRIYRNITSDCTWDCLFRDVCMAGLDGSNVQMLLDTLYTVREEEIYDME